MELSYGGESIRRGSVIRSGGGDRRGRDENHWTGSGLEALYLRDVGRDCRPPREHTANANTILRLVHTWLHVRGRQFLRERTPNINRPPEGTLLFLELLLERLIRHEEEYGRRISFRGREVIYRFQGILVFSLSIEKSDKDWRTNPQNYFRVCFESRYLFIGNDLDFSSSCSP